jgi:hypothetical protein
MWTPERKFLLIAQIVALLCLMYCIKRNKQIEHLVSTQQPQKFVVLKTYCHGRNSNIDILYSKGKINIAYPNGDCHNLIEGDSVSLYYSYEHDFFHIPKSPQYQNSIWGLTSFLILSVIPWKKLFSILGLKKDEE